jgi:aryl sulfotransferase
VVVRDPRDVFMSFWNHYSQYTDAQVAALAAPGGGVAPMPRCPDDIHALWPRWIGEGWFPWQSEGWPHSGNLAHTASWWRFRHLPNIRLVHYADLLADLPGEIAGIARFLGIALTPDRLAAVAAAVRFDALRRDAAAAGPMPAERAAAVWHGGLDTFFFRGTNGRWRDVLGADELALCDAALARCLTPACAAYVTGGRAAWTQPAGVAGVGARA